MSVKGKKKLSPKKEKTVKAVRAPMPRDIVPMAMVSTHEPFNHKDWLYELKWDGFRAMAYCSGSEGKLRSRNNQSFNKIEGIVAKYKQGLYYPGGRTTGWIKIKTARVVQGVIAGFILDEEKPGTGFNSLIIAKKKDKSHKYIGQVGAGVTKSALNKVFQAKRSKSIFSPVPNVNVKTSFRNPIKRAKIGWIKPDIKCEVKFLELNRFGIMRHRRFRD